MFGRFEARAQFLELLLEMLVAVLGVGQRSAKRGGVRVPAHTRQQTLSPLHPAQQPLPLFLQAGQLSAGAEGGIHLGIVRLPSLAHLFAVIAG